MGDGKVEDGREEKKKDVPMTDNWPRAGSIPAM